MMSNLLYIDFIHTDIQARLCKEFAFSINTETQILETLPGVRQALLTSIVKNMPAGSRMT